MAQVLRIFDISAPPPPPSSHAPNSASLHVSGATTCVSRSRIKWQCGANLSGKLSDRSLLRDTFAIATPPFTSVLNLSFLAFNFEKTVSQKCILKNPKTYSLLSLNVEQFSLINPPIHLLCFFMLCFKICYNPCLLTHFS